MAVESTKIPGYLLNNESFPTKEIPKKDINETPFRQHIIKLKNQGKLNKQIKRELLNYEKELLHEYNAQTQNIYRNDEWNDIECMEQQNVYWNTLKYKETEYLQNLKIKEQQIMLDNLKRELNDLNKKAFDIKNPNALNEYFNDTSNKTNNNNNNNGNSEPKIIKKKKPKKKINKKAHGQLIGFFNKPKKSKKAPKKSVNKPKTKNNDDIKNDDVKVNNKPDIQKNLKGFFNNDKNGNKKGLYDDVKAKKCGMSDMPDVITDAKTGTSIKIEQNKNANSQDSLYNKFVAEQKINQLGSMLSGVDGLNIERTGNGSITLTRKPQ